MMEEVYWSSELGWLELMSMKQEVLLAEENLVESGSVDAGCC